MWLLVRAESMFAPMRRGHLSSWISGSATHFPCQSRLTILAPDGPVGDVSRVVIGRTEDADAFAIRLGIHTLVAGATGSGKASAVHGLLIGLGPAIRQGLVQVHGIDLKGGMELGMAAPLLTRCATTPAEAVVVLEDAAMAMAARARRLAGHVRSHSVSTTDPMVVVLVDELAAITAYLTDRDLRNRAAAALSLLLSARAERWVTRSSPACRTPARKSSRCAVCSRKPSAFGCATRRRPT